MASGWSKEPSGRIEGDVQDFDVPEKNLTEFDQVLLLSARRKQVRDEVQAQSKFLTSSS